MITRVYVYPFFWDSVQSYTWTRIWLLSAWSARLGGTYQYTVQCYNNVNNKTLHKWTPVTIGGQKTECDNCAITSTPVQYNLDKRMLFWNDSLCVNRGYATTATYQKVPKRVKSWSAMVVCLRDRTFDSLNSLNPVRQLPMVPNFICVYRYFALITKSSSLLYERIIKRQTIFLDIGRGVVHQQF